MAIKFLSKSKIKNKTVLVRGSVDDVADEKGLKLVDDFRTQSFLPTVKFLLAGGNKVIICGKRKRAKGKVVPELTLKPVAERLASFLGYKFIETDHKVPDYQIPHLIFYSGDIREQKHQDQVRSIPNKDVVFLENLEYYPEELDNDAKFGKQLASLADIYVDDDFSKCHHPVASNVAVAKNIPAYCGLLLEKEIKSLDLVIKNVKHPFVIMTGGIKLSEKIGTLKNLGEKADKILVGGGVASLMFKAKGYEVGLSKIEEVETKTAWQIEKNFKSKLLLPLDVVVANKNMDRDSIRCCDPHEVKKNEMILDHGPKTMMAFARELKTAKTILWSGPLGLFEKKPFDMCTFALSRIIGSVGKRKAFAVVGGGDTVNAVRSSHQLEHMDHVSTGGGAMLEYLSGKKLPGIEALK